MRPTGAFKAADRVSTRGSTAISSAEIRTRANNDAQVAVVKCRQGDAAWAIPVLERELTSNKFTLPPRG